MRKLLRILKSKIVVFIVSLVWLASNIVVVYAQSGSVPPEVQNMVDKLLEFLQYIGSAILISGFIMAGIKLATADMPEEQAKAKKWLVALFLAGAIMVLARPNHNISSNVRYSPILVSTRLHDYRVCLAHAFKFVARLRDVGAKVCLRTEKLSGHAGASINVKIREYSDILAFAYKVLEVNVKTR